MRLESDHDSVSTPEPGPSNGYTATNGFTTNGSASNGVAVKRHDKGAVAKVSLPGSTLFDDTHVDREEFVRLVIQSLRDVGYAESAATLEAESGYSLESHQVTAFRRCILDGLWDQADDALLLLGVTDEDNLLEARFLISQQKYLEHLEAQTTNSALFVLRNELAPYIVDRDQLHSLSSLMMCSTPEEVRYRAGWDGAAGVSRNVLLANLQRYIPPSAMIPQRRFATLLEQSRLWQQEQCQYHNAPPNSLAFSLYHDHQCDSSAFPEVTTTILEVHTDEVWNLEWSHSGEYLASASKDKTAVIWRIGPEKDPSLRKYTQELVLRDHSDAVGCIAWSLDDAILLTSAEQHIKLWNTKSGLCIRALDAHTDTVTSIRWLPDDSGFISGGLDRRIIIWDVDGNQRDSWTTVTRITDLAMTPDLSRVVAVGMNALPPHIPVAPATSSSPVRGEQPPARGESENKVENRMVVYDMLTKQTETSLLLDGELTSVRISQDSKYALINHAPDEICLWDIARKREVRKFTGQKQGNHVIRSCLGGFDGNFVASGSEDGNVYVWHRDTGALLEVLSGHGEGSVNAVAWNPKNHQMFASCSDDHTIRIWEAMSPAMALAATANRDDREDESMISAEDLKDSKGKGRISL